ncbi:MAG: hypothetical protein FD121_1613, partial [Gallionellaceae bacterium]
MAAALNFQQVPMSMQMCATIQERSVKAKYTTFQELQQHV